MTTTQKFSSLLVLGQELFGLGQRGRVLLVGNIRLGLGEPGLEVVEVLQEAVQVSSLLQFLVTLL